jgi:hypothetical protein
MPRAANFFFCHTNLCPKKHFAGTAYRSGGPGSIRIATGHMGGDDEPDIKDRHTGQKGMKRAQRALKHRRAQGVTGGHTGQNGTEVSAGLRGSYGQKGIERALRHDGLRGHTGH